MNEGIGNERERESDVTSEKAVEIHKREEMDQEIEITDKTVEAAIERGLQTLGIKQDNAEVEVITRPGTGLLGLWGNKSAKVRVSVKQPPREYLGKMVETVVEEVDPTSEVIITGNDDDYHVSIKGNHMGILIGKKGQTLNSLQYLLNVIMRRQFTGFKGRVIVDIENYRERRKTSLEKLASDTAERVMKMKKEIELEPMSSYERRVVHLTLKKYPRVNSYSKGEEPRRKVVVAPTK